MGLTPSGRKVTIVARIRYIGVYRVTGDPAGLRDVMRRVGEHTRQHFGDRLVFDPFISRDGETSVWVNSADDADVLVEWEEAMGEFRGEAARYLEPLNAFVLDQIDDPRLEHFAGLVVDSLLD